MIIVQNIEWRKIEMSDVLATIQEFFAFITGIIKEFFGFFGGLFSKPDTDTPAEETTLAE